MNAPVLDVGLYAADALADSEELFARIREAGPVVWQRPDQPVRLGDLERPLHIGLGGLPLAQKPPTTQGLLAIAGGRLELPTSRL